MTLKRRTTRGRCLDAACEDGPRLTCGAPEPCAPISCSLCPLPPPADRTLQLLPRAASAEGPRDVCSPELTASQQVAYLLGGFLGPATSRRPRTDKLSEEEAFWPSTPKSLRGLTGVFCLPVELGLCYLVEGCVGRSALFSPR